MLRSAGRVLVVTLAPPSLQMRAAAFSGLLWQMPCGGLQEGRGGDGTGKDALRPGGAKGDD